MDNKIYCPIATCDNETEADEYGDPILCKSCLNERLEAVPTMTMTAVEWWGADRFIGRSITITSIMGGPVREITRIKIPDTAPVVCDWCNSAITNFPVMVVEYRATCEACRKRLFPGVNQEKQGERR